MNGNKFATGQILEKPVEVVKGRILAGWAQKSPEPWAELINTKKYFKENRRKRESLKVCNQCHEEFITDGPPLIKQSSIPMSTTDSLFFSRMDVAESSYSCDIQSYVVLIEVVADDATQFSW